MTSTRREGVGGTDIIEGTVWQSSKVEFGTVVGEIGAEGFTPACPIVSALGTPQIVGAAAHQHMNDAVIGLDERTLTQTCWTAVVMGDQKGGSARDAARLIVFGIFFFNSHIDPAMNPVRVSL